jgi:hypothetical protein
LSPLKTGLEAEIRAIKSIRMKSDFHLSHISIKKYRI